jgi:type I restriction enzyme S subunit
MGELVSLTSGQSPSGFNFGSRGIPYYKVDQLGSAQKYLNRRSTHYFCQHLPCVPAGSVLIAKRGGAIALNRVRLTTEPSFMDTNVMALTPGDEIDCEFLYYWLGYRGLWDIADVTSVPQINNKHIKPLEIVLPTLVEQRRIASVLDHIDGLISSLERLITKKQAIKQGMMQELLTGRTRLPGFTRNWVPGTFEDLASPVKERTLPAQVSPDTPLVELEQIEPATGRLLARSTVTTATSFKTRFSVGDVLFGKLRAYLRKFWIADTSGLCTTEIWAFRPKPGVSGEFVRFVVETDGFIEVASGAYGTHMPRSDWGTVRRYELLIPEPEEQKAIASVLMDADREIELLRARLTKAHDIKQGMMQELLTGRTRLPVQETVA